MWANQEDFCLFGRGAVVHFVFAQDVDEERIIKEDQMRAVQSSCWFGSVSWLLCVFLGLRAAIKTAP